MSDGNYLKSRESTLNLHSAIHHLPANILSLLNGDTSVQNNESLCEVPSLCHIHNSFSLKERKRGT